MDGADEQRLAKGPRLNQIVNAPPVLRATGRVGRLDVLGKSDLNIERKPNIVLPFCYPTR
jgi:hypothetical protein